MIPFHSPLRARRGTRVAVLGGVLLALSATGCKEGVAAHGWFWEQKSSHPD
ncbi:hypothetical protein PUR49_07765 [Streptomyces sp. BE147]|uniref:hypothetical protein n=1 Tax=Streptomyces sp. BE147 TaxID=3002524 RepID=UPI002E770D58|nr:hypothetical protein [Streptomyces sp. BE147]MEE1736396.1 hypothetical protein [Streptomyces sp. BE147]